MAGRRRDRRCGLRPFASYAPRRTLPGRLVRRWRDARLADGRPGGVGSAWSTALAAFFVGLVSFGSPAGCRSPLVVIVPAVVPMLPGLSIYRALSLLTEGDAETLGRPCWRW